MRRTMSSGIAPTNADGAPLGDVTLSGSVAIHSTNALTIGTHTITATYSGDINYKSSASNAQSLTVNPYRVYLPMVTRQSVLLADARGRCRSR